MARKKVKPGDTVIIDGVTYVFEEESAWAYNSMSQMVERGGLLPSSPMAQISLMRQEDQSIGHFFFFEQIRAALA